MASNIEKLINALLGPTQDRMNALVEVHRARFLRYATGVSLDGIGDIVGEPRRGLDDVAYRVAIRTRIRVLLSSGTIEDILSVFVAALGYETAIELKEYYPAAYEVIVHLTADIPTSFRDVLERVNKQAGAGGVGRVTRTVPVGAFRFAGGSGAPRGFGVGKLSSVG